MDILRIIIPTLYIGGIKPEEPKYGDIFYNDCDGKFFIYLDKWFEVFDVKDTEYTSEQKRKMEKQTKQEESETKKELKEYKEFIKMLRKLIKD